MKDLLLPNELTMSSREIALLVESRHDDVKRSIERLSERGVIQLPPMADVKNHRGQTVSEYRVGKRDSYVIVAQLSPEFTARLVDRWQELESMNAPKLPGNYIEALEALLSSEKEKQVMAEQIEQDRPKVEFALAVRNMQGACKIGDFAKALGTGRNRLFMWLKESGILMANRMPYQQFIDRGLFVVVEQIPYTDSKGKTHPAFTTMVTGVGQVWLEKKYRGVMA
jgi:anti-repressor protein